MILIDANIFMYAAGASHMYKAASLKFLHDVARMEYKCCLNAEVLQEILHRYRSIGRWKDGKEVYQLAIQIVPLVQPVTAEILEKTVELMDLYPDLMARDCLHVAHCLVRDLEAICSFDIDFDSVREIRRMEPQL